MSVPAFAQHIFIGDTETVVSHDEKGNKVIMLIFDSEKMLDFMKPYSPNYLFKEEQTVQPKEEIVSRFVPALTEAPKEGEVLANITYQDENGEVCFTEPYRYSSGQCT